MPVIEKPKNKKRKVSEITKDNDAGDDKVYPKS